MFVWLYLQLHFGMCVYIHATAAHLMCFVNMKIKRLLICPPHFCRLFCVHLCVNRIDCANIPGGLFHRLFCPLFGHHTDINRHTHARTAFSASTPTILFIFFSQAERWKQSRLFIDLFMLSHVCCLELLLRTKRITHREKEKRDCKCHKGIVRLNTPD